MRVNRTGDSELTAMCTMRSVGEGGIRAVAAVESSILNPSGTDNFVLRVATVWHWHPIRFDDSI